MKRVAGLSLLLFVGFGAAAPAKRPSSGSPATAGVESRAEPSSLRVALAHLHEEVRRSDDGSLVIENGNYQASFSQRGGVRFVPRIEARYERQLSWQYRARSIDTDTSRAPLDPVRPVVSATGDHVVDFERPGLIERYEGRRGGVEQIFVLTRRPAGRGDVRISGEVTFAGTGRRRGAAMEFGAGGASLTYGAPTAYDAEQRPVPVRTDLQGERLDLVLDGAALSRATFPVTIDPLFGAATTYVDPVVNALGHDVDVAYNWDRGEFLVVFDATREGTILDREIRAKRFFENGDAVATSYAMGRTWVINVGAKVAYDLHTNTYLVVWDTQDAVWGRRLASDGAPLGDAFEIGSGDSPSVAARNFHEHTSSEPGFLVAWADGTQVRHARISAASPFFETAQTNTTALTGTPSVAVAYDPHEDRFLVDVAGRGDSCAHGRRPPPSDARRRSSSCRAAIRRRATAAACRWRSTRRRRAYLLVAAAGGNYRGYLLSSDFTPGSDRARCDRAGLGVDIRTTSSRHGPAASSSRTAMTTPTRVSDIRLRSNGQRAGDSTRRCR